MKRSSPSGQPCLRCHGTGIEPDPVAIGAAMRKKRLMRGLTMTEVAKRMNFSVPYIFDLEHGRRPWGPKASAKYAEALRQK